MTHFRFLAITVAALLATFSLFAQAQEGLSGYQAIVSVADQKIAVVRDGAVVAKYPISTSRFGVGDANNSYKTPVGKLKVCEKLGDNLPAGAVIKHRQATGEVLTVNAPGRDPIVTRILWLDGQDAGTANAKARSIYIHGTPEERLIGRPASYGCIRMKSEDVIALYQQLGVGSTVSIVPEKLPHLAKYEPPKPTPVPKVEVAKATPAPAPIAAAPASTKVLAAIAEARASEKAAEEAAEREAKARLAKLKEPTPVPAKPEKILSAHTTPLIVARAESTPAPASSAPRLAVARERLSPPRPVVVEPSVDPDRAQFLRNRDLSLASTGSAPAAPTVDLAARMKGSILESGLHDR